MPRKIFGLERNVFFLGLVSFFNDFSNEMIVSVFPAFFQSVLKAGAASLGLVEGVADAFSNFAKIFSGRLSDTSQKRKRLAVIGYAISVSVRPFYVFAGRVFDVFGLRIVDRIGKGVREAPRDALISLSADPKTLSRSFGYHRAMDSLGGILGPLVAYLILRALPNNFNAVFITSFLVGTLAVLSFVFVSEIVGVIGNGGHKLIFGKTLPHNFKFFLASVFILSIGNIPLAVLLLRVTDLGLLVASIPLFYLSYSSTYTIFSLLAGFVSDKIGDRKTILIGYTILSLSYLAFMLSFTGRGLLVAFLLIGCFAAFTDGIQRSYTARLTDKEERGTAYGFLNAATGFGALVAGIGGGWTWQNYGAPITLAASSVIISVGLIFFIITHHHRQKIYGK